MSGALDTAPDVLVIGQGAAGATAAAAARAHGRSVVVIGQPAGATASSSGAFDIADARRHKVPGREVDPFDAGPTWTEGMERLVDDMPRHPYTRVGAAARARMRDALAIFDKVTPGLDFVAAGEQNLVLPTALGTVKRAARAQRGHALDLSAPTLDTATVAVVELECLGGFDAIPVAAVLRWVSGLSRRSVAVATVKVRVEGLDDVLGPLRLARVLDDERARDAFAQAVLAGVEGMGRAVTHVVLPPVLGMQAHRELVEALSRALAPREVGAVLGLSPSVAGARLSAALAAGIREAGAGLFTGRVQEATVEEGRVLSVRALVDGAERELRPRAVCLCSGRFYGGGITRDGVAREAVFGLPVVSGGARVGETFIGDLVGQRPEAEHPIFRAGIAYDAELRPLGRDGAPLAANLFAAGSVLEGYDPARDGSGLGVAVLTGLLAGERAAQVGGG